MGILGKQFKTARAALPTPANFNYLLMGQLKSKINYLLMINCLIIKLGFWIRLWGQDMRDSVVSFCV